eukprot:TRINITY_DN17634_c0_g1_i1.p1 TRINITY_DN17634_c0_g1~~TRINITY_DN17634_c0_g1_i1.p1  ORF type:complete len:307 (+),score=95.04 TRINITY_DN17634_c0_g1_i1:16-936(+)
MQTCQITYKKTTITVPIDVRASWLCKRFSLPEDSILGVTLPDGIEIDLTVDTNSISRSLLLHKETALLLTPKYLEQLIQEEREAVRLREEQLARERQQEEERKAKRVQAERELREARLVEQFLQTGEWPSRTLLLLILTRFHLPLDVRKLILRFAAPSLQEEDFQVHLSNIGYQNQGPTAPSAFTLSFPIRLKEVNTYHFWLKVRASTLEPPASVGLLHVDLERMYGPWGVYTTDDGMVAAYGSSPDYTWHALPPKEKDLILPAGTYHVIDSHIPSWSMNYESGNAGFFSVTGTKFVLKNPKEWDL